MTYMTDMVEGVAGNVVDNVFEKARDFAVRQRGKAAIACSLAADAYLVGMHVATLPLSVATGVYTKLTGTEEGNVLLDLKERVHEVKYRPHEFLEDLATSLEK